MLTCKRGARCNDADVARAVRGGRWHDTAVYCVIPVLVVVAQLVSSSLTKASVLSLPPSLPPSILPRSSLSLSPSLPLSYALAHSSSVGYALRCNAGH
eukprot:3875182-Rhodomonas_salina.1